MQFLLKGVQSMILHLCVSGKCALVLYFSIRRGEAKVVAPSGTYCVEGFLERSLICWFITVLRYVFTCLQVRLSDDKKMP